MMALSGVRSSWLMLARNFDLAWLASSARSSSRGVFLGELGELDGLPFELGLRALQVDDGGAQAAARCRPASARARLMRVMSVPTET